MTVDPDRMLLGASLAFAGQPACAAIGLGCIIGTLIEPVTHRPRSWTPATRLAIGINLATSAAPIGAGAWHSVTAGNTPGAAPITLVCVAMRGDVAPASAAAIGGYTRSG